MKPKNLLVIAWGSSLLAVTAAVSAWGQGIQWQILPVNNYRLFPLFGLLAFSLMWSHYLTSALKTYFKTDQEITKTYFEVTSLAVLAAILLHPGLLIWQLFRNDLGLPPGSLKAYIGPAFYPIIVLGAIAWTLFMVYELRRKFSSRPWWKFVQYASDAAMFMILVHAWRLGGELQIVWFRGVWYFYGVSLLVSLFVIYGSARDPLGKNNTNS